jgi:hypothetical protein
MRLSNVIVNAMVAWAFFCPIPSALSAQESECGQLHFENAEVRELAGDGSVLTIVDCIQQRAGRYSECICSPVQITVPLSLQKDIANKYGRGDHLWLDLAKGRGRVQLRLIQDAPTPSQSLRVLVLITSALSFLCLAAMFSAGKPNRLIMGQDNRYSNSKFQIAIWFWVLLSTYFSMMFFRIFYHGWALFGHVNIPQNLLLVSGISALTYGGAKAITTAKVDSAVQAIASQASGGQAVTNQAIASLAMAAEVDPKNLSSQDIATKRRIVPTTANFFANLVQNDVGAFDFGDFQMLIMTIVAVGMYLVLFFHFLAFVENTTSVLLPDVDTTILTSFGLGQGAYLTKKAAGDVGTA